MSQFSIPNLSFLRLELPTATSGRKGGGGGRSSKRPSPAQKPAEPAGPASALGELFVNEDLIGPLQEAVASLSSEVANPNDEFSGELQMFIRQDGNNEPPGWIYQPDGPFLDIIVAGFESDGRLKRCLSGTNVEYLAMNALTDCLEYYEGTQELPETIEYRQNAIRQEFKKNERYDQAVMSTRTIFYSGMADYRQVFPAGTGDFAIHVPFKGKQPTTETRDFLQSLMFTDNGEIAVEPTPDDRVAKVYNIFVMDGISTLLHYLAVSVADVFNRDKEREIDNLFAVVTFGDIPGKTDRNVDLKKMTPEGDAEFTSSDAVYQHITDNIFSRVTNPLPGGIDYTIDEFKDWVQRAPHWSFKCAYRIKVHIFKKTGVANRAAYQLLFGEVERAQRRSQLTGCPYTFVI